MITRRLVLFVVFGGLAAGGAAAGPFSDYYQGVAADDPAIVGWASGVIDYHRPEEGSGGYCVDDEGWPCTVEIAVTGRPDSFGNPQLGVYSLGNGGSITVSFATPVRNGPGPDLVVFENGFADHSDWSGTSRAGSTNNYFFAELATVEVASHTSSWARFPVTYLGTTVMHEASSGIEPERFVSQDVTLIDGLAGKHGRHGEEVYGTPFDLTVLTNHQAVLDGSVDLNDIRYVRITDVIGDGSVTDDQGRPVYDPYYCRQEGYPVAVEPFATQGFDLKAVAVLNRQTPGLRSGSAGPELYWYAPDRAQFTIYSTGCLLTGKWEQAAGPLPGDAGEQTWKPETTAGKRFFLLKREDTEP